MPSNRRLQLLGYLLTLGAVTLMAGCAAPTLYPEHALVDQIIKVRAGHEGNLTNRTVTGYDKDGKPIEKIKDYSLESQDFRETVNRLSFICNIGGKRYKICLDKPGFCRFSRDEKCFLGIFCKDSDVIEEYLPVEKYGFLLDANARCASREKYDLWASQ